MKSLLWWCITIVQDSLHYLWFVHGVVLIIFSIHTWCTLEFQSRRGMELKFAICVSATNCHLSLFRESVALETLEVTTLLSAVLIIDVKFFFEDNLFSFLFYSSLDQRISIILYNSVVWLFTGNILFFRVHWFAGRTNRRLWLMYIHSFLCFLWALCVITAFVSNKALSRFDLR